MDNERRMQILDAGEIPVEEFVTVIRDEAWMEDTSFEAAPVQDGGYNIEEHVWSMNAEHVRILVRVGRDGQITETGGLKDVELLKKNRVRVL